jgi:hypothetical protein
MEYSAIPAVHALGSILYSVLSISTFCTHSAHCTLHALLSPSIRLPTHPHPCHISIPILHCRHYSSHPTILLSVVFPLLQSLFSSRHSTSVLCTPHSNSSIPYSLLALLPSPFSFSILQPLFPHLLTHLSYLVLNSLHSTLRTPESIRRSLCTTLFSAALSYFIPSVPFHPPCLVHHAPHCRHHSLCPMFHSVSILHCPC